MPLAVHIVSVCSRFALWLLPAAFNIQKRIRKANESVSGSIFALFRPKLWVKHSENKDQLQNKASMQKYVFWFIHKTEA